MMLEEWGYKHAKQIASSLLQCSECLGHAGTNIVRCLTPASRSLALSPQGHHNRLHLPQLERFTEGRVRQGWARCSMSASSTWYDSDKRVLACDEMLLERQFRDISVNWIDLCNFLQMRTAKFFRPGNVRLHGSRRHRHRPARDAGGRGR